MTYQEAIDYLNSFTNYEKRTDYRYSDFSLDRVYRLLDSLGNPHAAFPSIHVAGTKGKGSTCAAAAEILRAAGRKVGLYTSPHLFDFRERFRIDGEPVPEPVLAALVERVRSKVREELTFFEVTTACAFLHFAEARVQAAVVEVGMGGRLDATNVLSPAVAGITPVSLDHMEKLGDTVEKIAAEKAGIIKPGVPVVVAPQPAGALRVIRETADRVGAPWHALEAEARVSAVSLEKAGTGFSLSTPARAYERLWVPLAGRHQAGNAAMAVRLVELFFAREGRLLDPLHVKEGLSAVRWPGRCQIVPGEPPVLIDGAQNEASAQALREAAGQLFPGRPVTLVFGASTEKDLDGMAACLGPWAAGVIVTRAGAPRAESIERLDAAFRGAGVTAAREPALPEALDRARRQAGPGGLVVVAGSLFLAAEAIEALAGQVKNLS